MSNSKLDAKTGPIMEAITQTVIDAMKAGTAPWQRPWTQRAGDGVPNNISTGACYRGLNSFYLMIQGMAYDCNYWVGFKQARKIGGNVRKGEKSTAILAPIMRKGEDKKTGDSFMYPAGFRVVRVFNVMQCDGIELPSVDTETRELDAAMLDQFAIDTGAEITHGNTGQACYIPSVDRVDMPAKNDFHSAGGYYGTLLHELTHWTGHKSRLDRLSEKNRRGYAYEELIAELGAYYASERIGCPNESENHASYLESWLKALDSDPKYLWQAASAAERAANYLIDSVARAQAKAA